MKIIVLLIGCSLLLAVGFLLAFFWFIRSGQADDTSSPAMRMLQDDEVPSED